MRGPRPGRSVLAVVPPTPQYPWPKLASRAGCTVWVKHENHTPTGAFKVRGGLVYLDRGGNIERARFQRILGGETPSAD
jgi:threonine dehydratase